MTSLSDIFSPEKVTASQQRRILSLENAGICRKEQAFALNVDASYIHHIAAGNKFFDPKDSILRYMCSAVNDDTPVEELLAGRKCVSPIPDVPYNGCTDDEVLDGAQAIGQTRFDAVRGDWRAVMAYGFELIAVGWRLVVHAKKMLGQDMPQKYAPTSVPLFEMAKS